MQRSIAISGRTARRAISAAGSFGAAVGRELSGMESAYDAAPIGLCVLDLDFRYIKVNACFARMYGLQEADFIGNTVEETLPDPAAQILAHLRDALRADGIVEREITLRNPVPSRGRDSRDELIYLRTAQPVRDEDGIVFGISVALLDITDRKRMDEALRNSEEDLRYTVELTPHIPWTADVNGEVIFISPRWQEITGGKEKVIRLDSWARVLHMEDRDRATAQWFRSVKTGDPYDVEYRIRTADGNWRWVRARAYPRRLPSGEIMRWYGMVEDIHDRKITSMQLEEATEELARRAQQDYLTGLPNRRCFDEHLGRELDRARRTRRPLGLIVLDIDHFKRYNDLCGHLVGDECLKAVAKALGGVLQRPADLAARFGGEEFAIILPETASDGAVLIANRAVEAVRKLSFCPLDTSAQRVTISAGVAVHQPGEGVTSPVSMTQLIQAADAALYEAKALGRNRVAVKKITSLI